HHRPRSRGADRLSTVVTGDLLARAREGDKRALARILSAVENDEPRAADILRELYPKTGRARIVGVTGPPGGGKSTLVNRLAGAYREQGERVAIVAVDPSSPFSGGALLGDRIRMQERALDEGLFIRSMASRGHDGGLARTSARVVNVLDAIGYSVVLVETVGVGQEEVDVVRDAARSEVESLLRDGLVRRLRDRVGEDRVERAVARVADRALDPYAAVDELLED